MIDENGTPWDQFVNSDGTLIKRESRDCIGENGRLQVGCTPMVNYARVAAPNEWFYTLRDLYAYQLKTTKI